MDGRKAAADLQPIIHNGRAYVPIRAVTAAFGLPVVWDAGTRGVNVTVAPEA
ncbi:stalk domain-containing protein [Paenibacillus terrigena]|uniref:stalk domain-containing protein n=1 Tax=Paenibacillus terrigena TaxID=369333 RepID=UPI0028D82829|nr:stalk domain-containing protein [Paenibacillus terrigena]